LLAEHRAIRALPLLAFVACALPDTGFAQSPLGVNELAKAKSMLDLYRAQLSAEQYELLSARLAQTEQAYVELTTLTGAGAEAAATASEVSAVTAARAGGQALLGSVAEALPVLIFFWPSTAHAPGMKEEKQEVHAAKAKLAKSVEELNAATRRVIDEQAAAAKVKKPKDSDKCGTCVCYYRGLGNNPLGQRPTRGDCRRDCLAPKDRPANGMTCTGDKAVEWWN